MARKQAVPPAPAVPPADPGATTEHGLLRTRVIEDVATLRVLSEPVRIAVLRTLMTDAEVVPPVMTAKELAAVLGEPQTKLYRHLKQLEEAGLIQVAETRVVSGILEQRYRASQVNLTLSRDLLTDPATGSDFSGAIAAALDDFRDELLGRLRTGEIDAASPADSPSGLGLVLQAMPAARMTRSRAIEFRRRVHDLYEEYNAVEDADGGVRVHSLICWYAVEDRT
ncbi:MAG TPA: helix-turn-helix domain-containing protein [Micromonosporaceae bacterium]|nr:helix-turn-helix domain-containing protein [Micromonosporaceae bacterium]